MKFMFIVKSAHKVPPTPALLEAMHKLAAREIEAGRMLDNGGLMPLAEGAQVRIIGGELSVLDGPFAETKEVIGGYAVFDLHSKEEAVWRRQSSSCSCTKTYSRVGKEPASFARSPLAALEAAPAVASVSLLRIRRSRQIGPTGIPADGLTRRSCKSLRPVLPCNHQVRAIQRQQHGSDT